VCATMQSSCCSHLCSASRSTVVPNDLTVRASRGTCTARGVSLASIRREWMKMSKCLQLAPGAWTRSLSCCQPCPRTCTCRASLCRSHSHTCNYARASPLISMKYTCILVSIAQPQTQRVASNVLGATALVGADAREHRAWQHHALSMPSGVRLILDQYNHHKVCKQLRSPSGPQTQSHCLVPCSMTQTMNCGVSHAGISLSMTIRTGAITVSMHVSLVFSARRLPVC
jgi:hypothetical protein